MKQRNSNVPISTKGREPTYLLKDLDFDQRGDLAYPASQVATENIKERGKETYL